jgi:transposase
MKRPNALIFMKALDADPLLRQHPKDTEVITKYGSTQKTWRHLNFFDYQCFLHCKTPRIELGDGGTETVNTPRSGLTNGFTLLFEAFIV